jgi:hypothetical protein
MHVPAENAGTHIGQKDAANSFSFVPMINVDLKLMDARGGD